MRKDLVYSPAGHDIAAEEYGYCDKIHGALHGFINLVMPAEAGSQSLIEKHWIPVFTGMTMGVRVTPLSASLPHRGAAS